MQNCITQRMVFLPRRVTFFYRRSDRKYDEEGDEVVGENSGKVIRSEFINIELRSSTHES